MSFLARPTALARRDIPQQGLCALIQKTKSKKTNLEADEKPRAQTATEEPCLWVPEGNLAGICWVGLWGLGGPWGL